MIKAKQLKLEHVIFDFIKTEVNLINSVHYLQYG